jgi:bis(5'-nucleosyl)-tetraphosphatase (symmetrical)
MTIYAVGDIQGCLSCLEQLLERAGFNPKNDQLWAVGDLVNRGPSSLETLRFCKSLGDRFRTTLGNHDLHLLAVAQGAKAPNNKDTLQNILSAPDRHDLLEWLRHQPLLISEGDYTLVHAGIPPQWTLAEAKAYAAEVEAALRSPASSRVYFRHMYGNQPRQWRDDLEGTDRLRLITNYLTRMRYCDARGTLEMTNKQPPSAAPPGYLPWYAHSNRQTRGNKIVFGHWASLNGSVGDEKNLFPLDTGCVWGGRMRLMSLTTENYIHQNCSQ